ncbi:hypothetical protein ACQEVB_00180 [Pseudonocardia sp. CA-107938]|uniref:hypothetical protein n=1 Tax=Pseudonocardia sp. CA-107938 TaxID=3240021 RepID=UPI003D940819
MGSPPDDGGRHRMHEPDIGAPRTISFPTDPATVHIPAQRAALDPPTEVIRHVVVPPDPGYDPYDWDGLVEQETRYAQRPAPPVRGSRWGVALGALVVTACAGYIAVAGIGGLRGHAVGPATSAAVGPAVTATFPASAIPPATETPVPTSAAPVKRSVRATTPPVQTTVPATTQAPRPVEPSARADVQANTDDGTPQLADAPPSPTSAPAPDRGPQTRTGPTPPPPGTSP